MEPNKPLAGIRVVDLTHYYAGPYATLLLSFLGADVVKVEPPNAGDGCRALYRHPSARVSLPFAMMNSNKRAITLDLKKDEGTALLKRILATTDVLVENFSPGVMERLGLSWETLHRVSPKLVYATLSGYGRSGEYSDLPAFDPVVQAMAGIMATTGEAEGPPLKAGPAVVDILGGTHLATAILAAIRQRDQTGEGLFVEVSLYDSVIATLSTHIGAHYGLGIRKLRDGNRAPGGAVVPYNVYPASDGHVLILVANDRGWRQLCAAIGRDDFAADERFETMSKRVAQQTVVDAALSDWTRTRNRREVMEVVNGAGAFCGMVQELEEVVDDESLHERGMLVSVDHPALGPVNVFTSPIRLNGNPSELRSASPALGEHNQSFYAGELGLSQEEIDELRRRGVL